MVQANGLRRGITNQHRNQEGKVCEKGNKSKTQLWDDRG